MDKLTYLRNSVSSAKNYINLGLAKAYTSILWKSDSSDKIKRNFSKHQSCQFYYMDAPHRCWQSVQRKSLTETMQECYKLRGAKVSRLFAQAFKIVVDSWEFTMLLLYIWWDDLPIFRISASNEQLQQQLEYTLLKPDCHRWWISKMQSGREDTLEERYAIKFYFKLGKNTTKTYGMLQTAFGASCMNRAWVFEWNKRFKEVREPVRDDERCGRSKEVNRPELISWRVRVTMLRF